MIEISNLRRYNSGKNVVRLEADIKFTDMNFEAPAETLWFEIDSEFGGMFVVDTYDPFVLVPLYLAMQYKTDLRIYGNVSKKLYKNLMWYGQKILCDFDKDLSPVEIIVDGFAPTEATGFLTGTGITCGIDSLSTLYDKFILEDDPDYKINALFMFNCGSHGDFGENFTQEVFISRVQRAAALAEELDLLLIVVDSNLHLFRDEKSRGSILFAAFYSCVLSMQNAISRYYVGSTFSYNEVKISDPNHENYDLAEFCESYFVPLIQTERTELIIDGCQYSRVDKTKRLADWDIAQRYLNVCLIQKGSDSTNCGECSKCLRTLLALEIMGKLENFSQVFDLDKYKEKSFWYRCKVLANVDKDIFCRELFDLAEENNFPMPTRRDCYVLDSQVTIFE